MDAAAPAPAALAPPPPGATMEALVFRGKCRVVVEQVPVPQLEAPGDALVRIDLAAVCGSDLHPYHCREEGLEEGTVMGHEFVGHVVATGPEVRRFKPGDRVMSPFTACCGACFFCHRGLTARCERSQLFGWREGGKGLHGAQAQYIRVPLAYATLAPAPADLSDELALLLGDILSTGFFCADQAGIAELAAAAAAAAATAGDAHSSPAAAAAAAAAVDGGPVVAVVGCGPVGLLAILGALELGAARVLAIDSVPERLALAARFGATPVNREQEDALAAVRRASGGRGADAVLEVVGAPSALRSAYDLVRPGGTISSVGCHTAPTFAFSPVEAYNKNITYRSGRCSARAYMDRLLPLVRRSERLQQAAAIITHRLPLAEGPRAYELFDGKAAGCIKAVLHPWPQGGR